MCARLRNILRSKSGSRMGVRPQAAASRATRWALMNSVTRSSILAMLCSVLNSTAFCVECSVQSNKEAKLTGSASFRADRK